MKIAAILLFFLPVVAAAQVTGDSIVNLDIEKLPGYKTNYPLKGGSVETLIGPLCKGGTIRLIVVDTTNKNIILATRDNAGHWYIPDAQVLAEFFFKVYMREFISKEISN